MNTEGASAFQREMDESMLRMMQDMHRPGYVGQADIDFLAMMIPHHAGAVDMARLVLQHGRDPATRQLAEEMSQTAHGPVPSLPAGAGPAMHFPYRG